MAKRFSKLGKKIRLLTGCALIGLCGFIPTLFSLSAITNNVRLVYYRSQLDDLPIPSDAEVMRRTSKLFNHGNGSYCGFMAGVEMESKQSIEEMQVFYDRLDQDGEIDFIIPFLRQGLWKGEQTQFWLRETDEGLVAFEIFTQGHESFDIRC